MPNAERDLTLAIIVLSAAYVGQLLLYVREFCRAERLRRKLEALENRRGK